MMDIIRAKRTGHVEGTELDAGNAASQGFARLFQPKLRQPGAEDLSLLPDDHPRISATMCQICKVNRIMRGASIGLNPTVAWE